MRVAHRPFFEGDEVDHAQDYVPHSTVQNRPLPSSKNPRFQNEAKFTTFLLEMRFICTRMENHFHIKG